jgi:hypothetical protein
LPASLLTCGLAPAVARLGRLQIRSWPLRRTRPDGCREPERPQDRDERDCHDGRCQASHDGARVRRPDWHRDQAGEHRGEAKTEVGDCEEGGDHSGPVALAGQPVQLAQATTEDKADSNAADDGRDDECPQPAGEHGQLQASEADQQQRQPGAHAAAGCNARGRRLADRGDHEDQERASADQREVMDAKDVVHEGRDQAAVQAEHAERGERAKAGADHDPSHLGWRGQTRVQADDAVGTGHGLRDAADGREHERARTEIGPEDAVRRHRDVLGEHPGDQRSETEAGEIASGRDHCRCPAVAPWLQFGQGGSGGAGGESCRQAAHDAGNDQYADTGRHEEQRGTGRRARDRDREDLPAANVVAEVAEEDQRRQRAQDIRREDDGDAEGAEAHLLLVQDVQRDRQRTAEHEDQQHPGREAVAAASGRCSNVAHCGSLTRVRESGTRAARPWDRGWQRPGLLRTDTVPAL